MNITGAASDYAAAVPDRRPRLASVDPPASAHETAALIAAIERFMHETRPAVSAEQRRDPWQRAALLEGTGREPDAPSPWGDPVAWG